MGSAASEVSCLVFKIEMESIYFIFLNLFILIGG